MRDPADEDYEIERKYLLRRMPDLPGGGRVLRIDQGYIPGRRLKERLRRTREGEHTSYFRTIKFGAGIKRLEIEEETTVDVFRTLWRLTRGKRIRKHRFVVEEQGTWEIDRFRGFDLVLAEIELDSEDEPIHLPAWLAPLVEREVTGDPEYTNYSLAR